MSGHAFVHAFVAATNQDEAILQREAARRLLRETFSGGGKKNDGGLFARRICLRGIADGMAEKRFDGFKKRLGLEDHAFAAAEGTIINGFVAVFGELAQILNMNVDKTSFAGAANDSVIERAGKEFRKNSDEIEAHAKAVYWRREAIVMNGYDYGSAEASGGRGGNSLRIVRRKCCADAVLRRM